MENKVNNICRVEFLKTSEVVNYQELPGSKVLIEGDWQLLPVARPPRLIINEERGKAGRLYVSDFSTVLGYKLLNKHTLIIKLSFDDGAQPMIIGDPSVPVRLLESHDLKNKTLRFTHNNWHYPFRLVEAAVSGSGSGSGSGGV